MTITKAYYVAIKKEDYGKSLIPNFGFPAICLTKENPLITPPWSRHYYTNEELHGQALQYCPEGFQCVRLWDVTDEEWDDPKRYAGTRSLQDGHIMIDTSTGEVIITGSVAPAGAGAETGAWPSSTSTASDSGIQEPASK